MKALLLLLISIVLITLSVSAQHRQDYIWHFGKDQNGNKEGVQASLIDFNEDLIKPSVREGGLEFDQNNASICDKDGNLLLYSNGCAVANRLGQLMPNGDSINAGLFFDQLWLGDCGFGYPGRQDILILPDPGNEMEYYIIHKTTELNEDNKHLKYTKVDMTLDSGLGDVVEKNKVFFEGKPLWSYLTAIEHKNQSDYWIIQPKRDDNVYYRFLLNETGIEKQDSLRIGYVFGERASSAGDAKFSPDGTKYAIYNTIDGLQVFDFDRATGELSNVRLYETDSESQFFSSVEFSSDNRFIYFMDYLNLWQLDLNDADPQSSVVLIDQYDGTQDPFVTDFFLSTLAPDCKIYIRGGSGANSMHVIKEPNKKGTACDFIQNAIRFPIITASGGFPNFPRFRVDQEDKCDPKLTSGLEASGWSVKALNIFPNPARDIVNIRFAEGGSGRLVVYGLEGILYIDQSYTSNDLQSISVDISQLDIGSYVLELVPDDTRSRVFYQAKLQVIR